MKPVIPVLLSALILVSCGEKEQQPEEPAPVVTPDITLNDEKDADSVFESTGGTKAIAFSATDDWTAQLVNAQSADWVSVSPQSGKAGKCSVSIVIKASDGSEDRSATVKLTCGSKFKLISITQKQKNSLTLSASSFEAGTEGGSFDVKVRANITYDVTVDPACSSWVRMVRTKALTTTGFVLTVDPNGDIAKREGSVTVAGESLSETIHIYQAGSKPSIVLTKNEYVFSYEAAVMNVEVSHNIEVTCVMPEGAPWISKADTKAMSLSKFSFNVAENTGHDSREAKIKFVNNENGLSETVTVTQNFKGCLVVAKEKYEMNSDGGQIEVTVGHNVDYDISTPAWIERNQTKAWAEDKLTFTVKSHRNPESREGTIVFKSKDGALQQDVEVAQAAADWNNIPTDEMWYMTKDGKKWEMTGGGPLFDVSILSNTWEDGVGVLKLSGAPTRVKSNGFMNNVQNMETLTEIALPSSLRVIEENGFYNMRGIRKLVIPEGVEEMKESSASQMFALETVTLPASLKTLGYNVFFLSPVKRFLGSCEAIIMDGMAVTREYGFVDQVTGIDYTGLWICKASSEMVDANIPDGIIAIDNESFRNSTILETMTIPSSLKMIGGDNFYSPKLRYIGGPYASADNRCYISYGQLQAFAPAGLKKYTTPSSITSIGNQVFSNNQEIEELVINDEVTYIGMYAFEKCPNLKSITLPAKLNTMSYDPFNEDTALENMYVRSLVPPSTSITYTVDFPKLKIHVPDSSIEMYKSSDSWSQYRKYLSPKHYEDIENPEYYYSTDFSAKGRVTRLQTASEGNGIDIVIMGDGFSDRQIAGGTYADWMKKAMESFFSVEPYKTYRSLFNVSSVDVVSNTEGFEHGTGALKTYFGQGTFVNGDTDIIREYTLKAVAQSELDNTTVIVIPNKDVYAGTCTMFKPAVQGGYAQGLSISWVPANANYETFSTTLNHEVGGHGFGKLQDEYFYAGSSPSEADISGYTGDKNSYSWYLNFDFTASRTDVSWAKFLSDTRYESENLGIFEGSLFQYNAYRPRESSIMRYNVGGYNAPSREVIYKRIMSLAYGTSWTYDFEDFVKYDKINIPQGTKSSGFAKRVPAPFMSEKDFIPLARPVVAE